PMRRLRRLAAEMRFAPPSKAKGVDLFAEHGQVVIGRDLYASTPGRAARIELLVRAASLADTIGLRARVDDDRSHAGRLVFDVPRRVLLRLGMRVPEPGDRFPDGRFVHCFFDEEPLREEIGAAGLVVVEHEGETWRLARGGAPPEHPEPFRHE